MNGQLFGYHFTWNEKQVGLNMKGGWFTGYRILYFTTRRVEPKSGGFGRHIFRLHMYLIAKLAKNHCLTARTITLELSL